MKLVRGKVVDGKVEVQDGALKEGASVTILTDDDRPLELTPEQQAELAHRVLDIEAGNFVEGDELLDDLARD